MSGFTESKPPDLKPTLDDLEIGEWAECWHGCWFIWNYRSELCTYWMRDELELAAES
jgi:hypothetical protein